MRPNWLTSGPMANAASASNAVPTESEEQVQAAARHKICVATLNRSCVECECAIGCYCRIRIALVFRSKKSAASLRLDISSTSTPRLGYSHLPFIIVVVIMIHYIIIENKNEEPMSLY